MRTEELIARARRFMRSAELLLEDGAAAVLLATGAPHGAEGVARGVGARGIYDILSFTGGVRRGGIASVGGDVVVEGYAPWAVTAARMARRLGARSVTLVTPFSPDAYELAGSGLEAARTEGIDVLAPARIGKVVVKKGKVAAVRASLLVFDKADPRGRQLDEKVAGGLTLPASLFIGDGGFSAAPGARGAGLDCRLMTARRGVFTAGDAVTGPRSVVAAVAMGIKAAGFICEYLECAPDERQG